MNFSPPPSRCTSADATVDAVDHVAFALQTLGGCYLLAVAKHEARRLLQGERALQLRMVDLSTSMPEGFRQNLVIARNRQPLEDVILAVLQ